MTQNASNKGKKLTSSALIEGNEEQKTSKLSDQSIINYFKDFNFSDTAICFFGFTSTEFPENASKNGGDVYFYPNPPQDCEILQSVSEYNKNLIKTMNDQNVNDYTNQNKEANDNNSTINRKMLKIISFTKKDNKISITYPSYGSKKKKIAKFYFIFFFVSETQNDNQDPFTNNINDIIEAIPSVLNNEGHLIIISIGDQKSNENRNQSKGAEVNQIPQENESNPINRFPKEIFSSSKISLKSKGRIISFIFMELKKETYTTVYQLPCKSDETNKLFKFHPDETSRSRYISVRGPFMFIYSDYLNYKDQKPPLGCLFLPLYSIKFQKKKTRVLFKPKSKILDIECKLKLQNEVEKYKQWKTVADDFRQNAIKLTYLQDMFFDGQLLILPFFTKNEKLSTLVKIQITREGIFFFSETPFYHVVYADYWGKQSFVSPYIEKEINNLELKIPDKYRNKIAIIYTNQLEPTDSDISSVQIDQTSQNLQNDGQKKQDITKKELISTYSNNTYNCTVVMFKDQETMMKFVITANTAILNKITRDKTEMLQEKLMKFKNSLSKKQNKQKTEQQYNYKIDNTDRELMIFFQ
ncbi:hypothetical protein TRFO_05758 [Tritrichomonas foetus]|uniref:Uncharacterized protein n=1 Tax=Tritrichomonas foetus TaxID=1144522 RepID=A0A1J4K3V7_9EUKA|nr:hypothetical protein TRFO_05758 [Tritrichomonas foetus]|eukprot:OHT05658.1 hypothetical protein TRFO_05758 [Tritrichomonas foetus]